MIDYSSAITPDFYWCAICRASGVKLWRTGTSRECGPIKCANCSMREYGWPENSHDDRGCRMLDDKTKTDQIGLMYPAIPCRSGKTYLAYADGHLAAYEWWLGLPTYLKSVVST